jgi:hypothetical protein
MACNGFILLLIRRIVRGVWPRLNPTSSCDVVTVMTDIMTQFHILTAGLNQSEWPFRDSLTNIQIFIFNIQGLRNTNAWTLCGIYLWDCCATLFHYCLVRNVSFNESRYILSSYSTVVLVFPWHRPGIENFSIRFVFTENRHLPDSQCTGENHGKKKRSSPCIIIKNKKESNDLIREDWELMN